MCENKSLKKIISMQYNLPSLTNTIIYVIIYHLTWGEERHLKFSPKDQNMSYG